MVFERIIKDVIILLVWDLRGYGGLIVNKLDFDCLILISLSMVIIDGKFVCYMY